MTNTATTITVLIPARNAQATLAETLESLEHQTLKNFDVLLVDDGSTDSTVEIARSFQSRIAIEVLSLSSCHGVAGALNAGLSKIQHPLIARLDADDIARPERLKKQWEFLEHNPAVDVCSTWMELFYESPGQPNRILAKPQEDSAIKTALIQYCSMSHGASMFRKSFFDDVGHFDIRLDFAEDYDLWCRGALLGKNYANLPEPLTLYRQHAAQVGKEKRELQYERDLIIKRKYISALLGGTSTGHLAEFFSMLCVFSSIEVSIQVIEQSFPLLLKLGQRVEDTKAYSDIVTSCIGRHLRKIE
jgi:glycosyltransferase involved in cell wall biosynthesis